VEPGTNTQNAERRTLNFFKLQCSTKKENTMSKKLGQYLPGPRFLYAGLAICALAAIASPGTASANSTANTTILNTVTVSYKDVTLTNTFSASASTIVTVNLVKAALNTTGVPTAANGSPALTCLAAFDVPSGSTINSLYALTATANGQDTYSLALGTTTPHNVNGVTVSYSTLKFDGSLETAAPASRVLGSAIPTAIVSDTVLQFPGGALAGFSVNDVVVVQTTAGPRAYLVTAVSAGTAPVYSNVGNTAYSTLGTLTQAEVKGTLTLGAYAAQTITLNTTNDTTIGGTVAPTFASTNAATLGVPVGELVLVKVSVQASTNTLLDGTVDYLLNTTASGGTNPATVSCTVGTFKAPTLTIKKETRNLTASGSFGATATGNPGDILEYRVTVTNTGGQAAQVVVADAVPVYTSLVAFGTSYGVGAPTNTTADFFASVSNGLSTINLTRAADSETQPTAPLAKVGFGKTGATTAAGSPLTFYLGDSSTNAAGGKIPACSDTTFLTQATCTAATKTWVTTYTILYQVKID
jgi:uncharacterized repeat protein (TIGR01451 family)